MVGLGNVDNTSDANKQISTRTQEALDTKAPLASPTFTGTIGGITKAMVGLGNVDNTADADKQVSSATQQALDAKADKSTTYTKNDVDLKFSNIIASAPEALNTLSELAQALSNDGNYATTAHNQISSKAPIANPTFTGTVNGITKDMVGLGNVDNTTDANKQISIRTQEALDLKAPLASPTFTGTVGGINKSMVGLGNVDNTADADKQISIRTQEALDTKAPLASPTFTGTVGGLTKAMVGLGNVDNTADANKQVSSATQQALDAKADKSTT
jgi:hypothetical protein